MFTKTRFPSRLFLSFIFFCFLIFPVTKTDARQAGNYLPYLKRTHNFSGYSTGVHGDIRTVGMAGATLGLADTFIASTDNPAGLAMTLNTGDTNFAHSEIFDSQMQDENDPVASSNIGVALGAYPWGFSLGYIKPLQEGRRYVLPTPAAELADLEVVTREFHAAVGRVFLDDRLSFGLSLNLSQAARSMEFVQTPSENASFHSYSASMTVGTLYQLPERILIGASFALPIRYQGAGSTRTSPKVQDFFQAVDLPWRAGLGIGWIPNRFFRADLSTFLIGSTPQAALLANDQTLVGQRLTLQPKLGVAYQWVDYKEIKSTVFAGTYYEVSRIQDSPNRFHITTGIEAKLWVASLGFGLDRAKDYKNIIGSVGVDVFLVMAKLGLIPTITNEPYGGLVPNPFFHSNQGLPRTLVRGWQSENQQEIDPIQIGLDIPSKIGSGVKKFTDKNANQMGNSVMDAIGSIPKKIKKEVEDMKKVERRKRKKQ